MAFHLDSDARGEQIAILSGIATIIPTAPRVLDVPGYIAKYAVDLLIIGSSAERMSEEYSTMIVITLDRPRGY